jgi:uncharacterized protein YciI
MAWVRLFGFVGLLLAFAGGSAAAEDKSVATEAAPQAQETSLFVFTYRPGPAWKAGVPMAKQGLGPHGAYIKGLLDSGQLFAGGGFVSSDGGMAIVRAESPDAARAVLAADPAITSGIFVGSVEQWRPRFHSQAPLIPD